MVGEFKDDQFQNHTHAYSSHAFDNYFISESIGGKVMGEKGTRRTNDPYDGRSGSITRGKRKGIKYIIKMI